MAETSCRFLFFLFFLFVLLLAYLHSLVSITGRSLPSACSITTVESPDGCLFSFFLQCLETQLGRETTYYTQGFRVGEMIDGRYYVNNHVHLVVDYHALEEGEVCWRDKRPTHVVQGSSKTRTHGHE